MARLATALADRYTIERELGQGGMATVYLARDVKHDRDVAIKVLRPELAAVIGAERFLREIKTIATLQHPHILGLIDSGEVNGTAYYVMPFVDGESLRDRLTREKQLPITDALRIATEVAGALDYAHRRGVIHRDIKPENILLHDGSALVADFGIALAVSSAGGGSRMTETGMSLGTPHYMSPEQAMGEREITARSDVYALGAMTYEMLTGDPPFTGSTVQAIVAKVMTSEPAGLIAQRKNIPPAVEEAVLTALEKLPADRFGSAAEFAAALHGTTATTRFAARTVRAPAGFRARVPTVTAGLLAVALLVAVAMLLRRPAAATPFRASLLPPHDCEFAPIATSNLIQISPDGDKVAFVAVCGTSPSLWIRSLTTGDARQIPGSDNASYPFWAPNSQSLGFFADIKLKRIDLATGAVQEVATVVAGRGGSWSRKDIVLYAPDIAGPLYQVPATGGIPERVTSIPADSQKLLTDRNPVFLPDGEHFLYSRGRAAGSMESGTTRLGRLGAVDEKIILNFASNVAYADGRLLFGRKNLLLAQPFDPSTGRLSGQPQSVVSALEWWAFRFLENFSVSGDGRVLVYRTSPTPHSRMEWFDPKGGTTSSVLEAGPYSSARISPDQRTLLVERSAPGDPLVDAWTYDLITKGWARLTSHPSVYYDLVWGPDGRRFAFDNPDDSVVYITAADRASLDTLRDAAFVNESLAQDWSPDGKFLIGWRQVQSTGFDIVQQALDGKTSRIVYATAHNETTPRISRDGRFLAYASDQTGRYEVFVTRMPSPDAHWQVSQDGVALAAGFRFAEAWGPGGLLYFVNPAHRLVVVSVADGGNIGKATLVPGAPDNIVWFDVAADGRILLLQSQAGEAEPLSLIEHWTGLLAPR